MLSVVWRTSDQGLLLIPDCLLKSKQSSCWREKIWIYMQESPKPWPWQRVNWWTFYTDFLLLTSLLFSPSLSPPLNIFIPASFPVQHHLVSRATPHISPPRDRDPPLHFRPFLTDTCLSTLLSLLHMTHYSSYKRLAGKTLGTNRWLSSNFLSLSKLPLKTITLANHKLEPHESRGWFYLYPEKIPYTFSLCFIFMNLITGMDAVTVPEHSSHSCIWLNLLCWCYSGSDQFLLILIHLLWRAEAVPALDVNYKLWITVVSQK